LPEEDLSYSEKLSGQDERQVSLGILFAFVLAVPFAGVIMLVDRKVPFPVDMNVTYEYLLTMSWLLHRIAQRL
jgi:hypothetical protein